MYDPVTLDQMRAFVCVVEEGSFSAAARKLKRVQSAISTAMANLENQLGVPVWDRTTKIARLTPEGKAVLVAVRRVLAEVDALRNVAGAITSGLEASVSLCVDALFPLNALIGLCAAFAKEFPTVDLRIDIQVMSGVSSRVLSGDATLGVVSPGGLAAGLEREVLGTIRMVPVVAPDHPLAKIKGPVSLKDLADEIQIVLSERGDVQVADQGVLSPRNWRVADLHTKHAMLRAGLGWGNLPEHLIRDELKTGALVPIRPKAWTEEEHLLSLSAIYRSDSVFGPAHRWMLAQLQVFCAEDLGAPAKRKAKKVDDGPRG